MGSDEERLDALLNSINLSENDAQQKQQESKSASALDRLKKMQSGEEDDTQNAEADDAGPAGQDILSPQGRRIHSEDVLSMSEEEINRLLGANEKDTDSIRQENEGYDTSANDENLSEIEALLGKLDNHEIIEEKDYFGEEGPGRDFIDQDVMSDEDMADEENILSGKQEKPRKGKDRKQKNAKEGGFFAKLGFGRKKKKATAEKPKAAAETAAESEPETGIERVRKSEKAKAAEIKETEYTQAAETPAEVDYTDTAETPAEMPVEAGAAYAEEAPAEASAETPIEAGYADMAETSAEAETADAADAAEASAEPEYADALEAYDAEFAETARKNAAKADADSAAEQNEDAETAGEESQVDEDILNSVFDTLPEGLALDETAADAAENAKAPVKAAHAGTAAAKQQGEEAKTEKKGLIQRILDALFEEAEPDEDENAEAAAVAAEGSEGEAAEGAAAVKGGKKPKKEKKAKGKKAAGDNPEEKPKPKAKAEKKPKKEKVKKEKVKKEKKAPPEDTEPQVKISKKRIGLVAMLGFSILVAIMVINTIGIDYLELTSARQAYATGDYQTTYDMYVGKKLDKADEAQYQRAVAVLKMQNKVSAFSNHQRLGKKAAALNDLIEGVSLYQRDMKNTAFDLITAELKNVYQKILSLLLTNYNLTESDAKTIAGDNDDYTYSLRIDAVVNGTKYVDPNSKEGQAALLEQSGQSVQNSQAEQNGQQTTGQVPDALPPEQENMNNGSNS